MKKLFLSLLFCMFAVSSFAQFNVYARMFQVYSGKVQKIVVETTGEVFKFDREGRIISYSMGPSEIRYSWSGNKITLAAYQDGNKMGEEYWTVTKNTSSEISISMPNGTISESYRENGSWKKSVISSNGQSMIEVPYYHSESEKNPYKYTLSIQGQTETFELSGYQYDAKGNWTKQTIKNNGQSQTDIRTITYYN